MPIYEFRCQDCQSEFELLVRSHETSCCPECGNQELERQMSSFASQSQSASLPMSRPLPGNCGRPQCGTGGCQGLG